MRMKKLTLTLVAAAVAALFTGCQATAAKQESATAPAKMPAAKMAMKAAGPAPLAPLGKAPIPPDNKLTPEKVELGKLLFFDPRVGGDASTGCSTCHEPEQGWAWAEDFSRGYPGTVHWRNSQSIINSAYFPRQFWAGSASSNEKQAKSAAKGGVAGNGEDDIMEARLALIPGYRKRFKAVFGTEWPIIDDVWHAISAFERTMNTTGEYEVPLDKYLKGDKSAMSEEQVRGMALFNGKAGCINCHNGELTTDLDFHNIGVPPNKRWEEDGLAQITFRFEQYAKGQTEKGYRAAKSDWGFYYRSKNKWDKGKFRTAPLRYIAYTAPYMHNGVFYTLEEVIDFYNRGGVDEEGRTTLFPKNKSPLIKPLGLTDQDKEDLVAFLEAFSGPEIMMEKPEQPPYAPLFNMAELKAAQEAK
ncbi:MAG: cytochrome-c peroxidase [Candidatus Thiodiazotropha sp. (ex Lucinoma kastoroae)]|nr:cytochrome-c peroxidase [Candidatus Thiodiazotropha sp. (ex Lucinoma kastoroae)]MCU7859628.1 cytochrome-c peroxidase [Candidatus Thiodiazotropha sp. (ex Lucinoma kastoroae)]